MSNQSLHQQLATLSQHFAELETTVKSQNGHTQQDSLINLVSKIRYSLDTRLLAQKQQQSTECDRKLSLLVQRNPLAVIEWNINFEVVDWNPAAERMFGYSKSEAIGRCFDGFIVPKSTLVQVDEVKTLLLQEGGSCTLNGNLTKDGRLITCEWYNTTLVDADGIVTGVISIVQDVRHKLQEIANEQAMAQLEVKVEQRTSQLQQTVKKLQQEVSDRTRTEQKLRASQALLFEREQMYKQILDSTADMVLVKGQNSKIVWANKAFRDYYGMTNEQLEDIVDAPFNEPDYTLQYIKDDAYVFETGEILEIAAEPVTRYDGVVRLFSTVKSPICNQEGEVIMTVGVSRDITERQKAAAALAESEAIFRRFVEDANDIIHSVALDGRFTYISPNVTEVLGYEVEELVGKSFVPIIYADDVQACIDHIKQVIETGIKQAGFEFRAIRKDGSCCWLTANSSALKDADGKIIGVQGIVRDISLRKSAEAALVESESKYRNLVEASQYMIWATDKEGRYTFVNSAVRQIHGYEPEEMIGRSFMDFVAPEQLQKDIEIAERVLAGESFINYETIHVAKNGNFIHLAFNVIVLRDQAGSVVGATGTANDITKRKIAETERDRFFNISLDMLCICGMDGYFKQANPAFETALGYTAKEMLAQPFINFVHPNDIEKTLKEFALIGEGATTINFENRYRCKDGSYKWLSWKAAPYLEDGLVYAMARDVSDRKKAVAELQRTTEELQAIFQALPDLYFRMDANGIILDYKASPADELYVPPEVFLGTNMADNLPYEVGIAIKEAILETMQTKSLVSVEYELSMPKGRQEFEARLLPLRDEQLIVIVRNISDRKKALAALRESEAQLRQQTEELENTLRELQHTQSQLVQSEKMSSLGQLVAGVAHEINNPVNFIYANLTHADNYISDLLFLIQLYQKYYPTPLPQLQEQAEEIDLDFLIEDLPKLFSSMKVGSERIQKIVASLRTFSRMDEAEVKAVDIHEGIDSTLMILQHRLKAKTDHPAIEVIKEYGNLPLVECYAGQLNQVFMNILSNAIDALEEVMGNRSLVMGKSQESSNYQSPTIQIRTSIVDKNVEICIGDNGPGIAETVRQKLFDPFFTTKPVGKGTGMGLSISYQIITERHKGSLRCISSPGKGAKFVITIPLKAC